MLVVYVGPFTYPSSNANSLRVKGVATALMIEGHEVIICPGLQNLDSEIKCDVLCLPEIHQLDEYSSGLFSKLSKGIRSLFIGDFTIKWLQNMQRKPDVVILYGTHLGYLMRLRKYCQRTSIRLIVDVVEWYDPRHLPGGLIGPYALSNEVSMRFFVPKVDRLMVISSYLDDYYRSKGCATVRVPPLFSEFPDRPIQLREDNGLLNLCYSGTPGKKEEFELLVKGVLLACDLGIGICLHIIGMSRTDFVTTFFCEGQLHKRVDEVFKCYGRLSNVEARRLVASSDYLLLARKPLRFANAGFPFKIAESMSLGTPVITNRFSDVHEYLQDDFNAFLIDQLDVRSLFDAIKKAVSIDDGARILMQNNAKTTAKRFFSVHTCPRIL